MVESKSTETLNSGSGESPVTMSRSELRSAFKALLQQVSPSFSQGFLQEILKLEAEEAKRILSELALERALQVSTDSPLQESNASVNYLPVVPTLDELRQRIDHACNKRGKKGELAQYLNVSAAQLSPWLRSREPGANVALRMLEWVQAEEAKQKSSASADTPAEPKTRKKQNYHELPKSSPQSD